MTFLDLFAGIGGFRRGLERSGHACAGHVEIDKYANKSYMAMYGLEYCPYGTGGPDANSCRMCRQEVREDCDGTGCGEKCKGEWYAKDIEQLTAGEVPKAEIWTFGFPCTDISISGRMAGLHGARSGLFFAVTGLLKGTASEDKPGYLIIENVKNLVSNEGGGDFTTVLSELWEAGYDCEWNVVNSKDHGVPQHRERVYIVGYFGGRGGRKVFPLGGANPTPVKRLLDGKQGKRVYDPAGTAVTLTANGGGFAGRTGLYAVPVDGGEGIAGEQGRERTSIASDTGAKDEIFSAGNVREQNCGQGQAEIPAKMPPCASFIDLSREPKLTDLSRSVMAKQYAGITNHKGETSGIFICKGHPECVRAVIAPDRTEKRQNGRRFKELGEPSFTLTCQDRHGILLCCMEEGLGIREAKKDGYTKAVHGDGISLSFPNSTTSRGRVGKQCAQTLMTGGNMGVLLCCRIRRLTPRECWRLQAFDDFLFDRAEAAGISDAQLYKQAGNAVTVNVVYEIGLKLAGSGRSDGTWEKAARRREDMAGDGYGEEEDGLER